MAIRYKKQYGSIFVDFYSQTIRLSNEALISDTYPIPVKANYQIGQVLFRNDNYFWEVWIKAPRIVITRPSLTFITEIKLYVDINPFSYNSNNIFLIGSLKYVMKDGADYYRNAFPKNDILDYIHTLDYFQVYLTFNNLYAPYTYDWNIEEFIIYQKGRFERFNEEVRIV